MGTRALIHVKESGITSHTLVTIYKQFDGYIDGLGEDIYEILNKGIVSVVNGYQMGDENPLKFNGMGCLAAYLVKELKNQIGDIYLYPPDSKDCGEEYTYNLYLEGEHLMMQICDDNNYCEYWGKLSSFPKMLKEIESEHGESI